MDNRFSVPGKGKLTHKLIKPKNVSSRDVAAFKRLKDLWGKHVRVVEILSSHYVIVSFSHNTLAPATTPSLTIPSTWLEELSK